MMKAHIAQYALSHLIFHLPITEATFLRHFNLFFFPMSMQGNHFARVYKYFSIYAKILSRFTVHTCSAETGVLRTPFDIFLDQMAWSTILSPFCLCSLLSGFC